MSGSLPISVVIPAYAAERSLAAAIAGVRAQTRPPREIIVVDDGSCDRTSDVARELDVRVHVQPNAGCGAARNSGIRLATQPWIALLDADDHWSPGKLAAQWQAVEATGDALCATDFRFVHPDGTRSPSGVARNRGYRHLSGTHPRPDVLRFARSAVARALPIGMFLLPSTLLFRRSLVVDNDEWFMERSTVSEGERFHLPEDCEWCLRMLRWTDVTLVERVLVDYEVVADSLSSNAGRMRYGDAKLGQLVCAEPARYAEGAAFEMRRLRPYRLREASVAFMRRLEFESANFVAREAYAERRKPPEALLFAASRILRHAPAAKIASAARALWRRRNRSAAPLARPLSR